MKHWLFCILLLALMLTLAACGGGEGEKNGGSASARDIYLQNCASCHGQNLEGGAGPALQHVGSRMSKEEILEQIKNGGGGMPPNLIEGKKAEKVATWLAEHK